MIAIEKEIIGADPETGKPIIRAFIVASETPEELPTDGSTVDNLADDEKLGVFSILYVVADSSVYIANEEGEFVLQSSGGGGGGDEGIVIYAEYDAIDGSWTTDSSLIEVFEWMDGILNDDTIANPEEYITTHLTLVAISGGETLTLACEDFSNANYHMAPAAEYICFGNIEHAITLYYQFFDIHGNACTRADSEFDGWRISDTLPTNDEVV